MSHVRRMRARPADDGWETVGRKKGSAKVGDQSHSSAFLGEYTPPVAAAAAAPRSAPAAATPSAAAPAAAAPAAAAATAAPAASQPAPR